MLYWMKFAMLGSYAGNGRGGGGVRGGGNGTELHNPFIIHFDYLSSRYRRSLKRHTCRLSSRPIVSYF